MAHNIITRKYLAHCSFVGLKYRGYQEQKFSHSWERSVQQTLEVFLRKNGFYALIVGSS